MIDNGAGLSKDAEQRLWEPFWTSKEGGTGLGLTLAQSFVQQHHGTIECESRPGFTCFTIRLPLSGF